MQVLSRIGRAACGIVLVATLVTGCAAGGQSRYETWQFERAVEEISRGVRGAGAQPPGPVRRSVKPASQQPKTTDSTRDDDDRHPSRWKRKLKAAYA